MVAIATTSLAQTSQLVYKTRMNFSRMHTARPIVFWDTQNPPACPITFWDTHNPPPAPLHSGIHTTPRPIAFWDTHPVPAPLYAGIHTSPPSMDRMTDTCKNITLPQTSFAGGNKYIRPCLPRCRS